MALTKEYLDFVMEQLSGLDELNSRAMMGEYILYYRGRIFGGIYDYHGIIYFHNNEIYKNEIWRKIK